MNKNNPLQPKTRQVSSSLPETGEMGITKAERVKEFNDKYGPILYRGAMTTANEENIDELEYWGKMSVPVSDEIAKRFTHYNKQRKF